MSGVYVYTDPEKKDIWDEDTETWMTWCKVGCGNIKKRAKAYGTSCPAGYMYHSRVTDNMYSIETELHDFLQIHGLRNYVPEADDTSQHETFICTYLSDIESLIDFVVDNWGHDNLNKKLTWSNYKDGFCSVDIDYDSDYQCEDVDDSYTFDSSNNGNGRFGHNVIKKKNRKAFNKNYNKYKNK